MREMKKYTAHQEKSRNGMSREREGVGWGKVQKTGEKIKTLIKNQGKITRDTKSKRKPHSKKSAGEKCRGKGEIPVNVRTGTTLTPFSPLPLCSELPEGDGIHSLIFHKK